MTKLHPWWTLAAGITVPGFFWGMAYAVHIIPTDAWWSFPAYMSALMGLGGPAVLCLWKMTGVKL